MGNVAALLALTLPTMLYSLLFLVTLALIAPQKVFSRVGWLAWFAITPLAILVPLIRVTEENEPVEGPEVFLVPQLLMTAISISLAFAIGKRINCSKTARFGG
jgi:4-hydroxybenzoate polyprenyltransferase